MDPADGLTQDESAAIRLYTKEWDTNSDEPRGSRYVHLNRTKLRPWFRYLKLFLTALAKLSCARRQTVRRGIRNDHSADYPPGAEFYFLSIHCYCYHSKLYLLIYKRKTNEA
jgi:hypothetical protein